MAAVAFETALDFQHRLRVVPSQRAALEESPLGEPEPAEDVEIEHWELHSELVLVCPEIRERARELLPARNPDGFLARTREPASRPAGTAVDAQPATRLPVAVFGYAVWRLAETVRTALFVVGGVVALALLAEVLH